MQHNSLNTIDMVKRLENVATGNAKAVLWVRTSTKRQEVESQIADLRKMAERDGFGEEEMIILGGAGLSAIKLKDDYLQELSKLMATLRDNPEVTNLYTWEVSRLARVETKFYELKAFLVEEGIQLALYAGGYRLFRKSGEGKWEIDRGVEIGLSIFVTMAQQEMQIKKERFDRARRRNKSEGKRNGGRFRLFGYDVQEGKYVPNPTEAKLLNELFKMYAQGSYSYEKLAKWLNDNGHKTTSGGKWDASGVSVVLKKEEYCGDIDNRYPELITRALYEKVAGVRKANVKGTGKVDKASKRVNLAVKILKCENCGSNYVAGKDQYFCYAHNYPTHAKNAVCEGQIPSVNIKLLDRILWAIGKGFEGKRLEIQRTFDHELIKNQVKDMQKVVDNKKAEIKRLQATSERTNDLYIKGKITLAEYDRRVEEIDKAIGSEQNEIDVLNKKILTWSDKEAVLKGVKRNASELHYTDQDKYDVVHSWISTATVKVEQKEGESKKHIITVNCGFQGIEFGKIVISVRPFCRSGWTDKVKFLALSVPKGVREEIAKNLELPLPNEVPTLEKFTEKYGEHLQERLQEVLKEMEKGRTPEDLQEEWDKEAGE